MMFKFGCPLIVAISISIFAACLLRVAYGDNITCHISYSVFRIDTPNGESTNGEGKHTHVQQLMSPLYPDCTKMFNEIPMFIP
jgi:hypothetical protein